jgi:hypothetical protein
VIFSRLAEGAVIKTPVTNFGYCAPDLIKMIEEIAESGNIIWLVKSRKNTRKRT